MSESGLWVFLPFPSVARSWLWLSHHGFALGERKGKEEVVAPTSGQQHPQTPLEDSFYVAQAERRRPGCKEGGEGQFLSWARIHLRQNLSCVVERAEEDGYAVAFSARHAS